MLQDPRLMTSGEVLNSKSRKRKVANQRASVPDDRSIQGVQVPVSVRAGQKGSKRNLKTQGSPSFQQQPEWSNSDSLPDSSSSGSEYRALRRKYLLLEEESYALGAELKEVEDEVKTLEDEKIQLLDQLVVLEGLVDPSEPYFS
ncbi:hypothetical protein Tsubulata_008376 [Turnera subulata]|uniref:Uncharacterized protein n=1 Tax=Turnera subulata TaxID=218843 RepID=A0A9Q0J679_9ROSI|nr:hypothetical protein Tsubulata_008376 [Turnera subulata]